MNYEELLHYAEDSGITVEECDLEACDGLCYGNLIFIDKKLKTNAEKSCVLAEEIGHYQTSSGDILDLNDVKNLKQEAAARLIAYNNQIGLSGIAASYRYGCRNLHEMAAYLDVTEAFLREALECYKGKYGVCVKYKQYTIYFEPNLMVWETFV